MKRSALNFCVIPLLLVGLTGCGGGSSSSGSGTAPTTTTTAVTTTVNGVAQGPIVSGSVKIQGVDASMAMIAASAPVSTTTSALGVFAASAVAGSTVELSANGKYWDEVYAVSTGTLTLGSYASGSDTNWNVNILTTLAQQRIANLVNNCSPMSFQQARKLAEQEVLAAFYIRDQNTLPFGSLDLSTPATSAGSDEDHILAAITSVFENNGSGNPTGQVSNLITSFQSEIAANSCNALTNTTNTLNSRTFLDSATATKLEANANGVSPTKVASNLTTEYIKSVPTFSVSPTDISDWLDQDGDHVIGKYKFLAVQAPLKPASNPPTPLSYTFPLYSVGASDATAGATYYIGVTNPYNSAATPNSSCQIALAGGVPTSNVSVSRASDRIQVTCQPAAHEVSSTYLLNGPSGTGIPISRYDFTPFALTQKPMANARTYATATTLLNGKVLVTGGLLATNAATSIAELYDPGNETWTTVAPMKNARAGHTATLLNSGKVLVVGGDGTKGSAELYDPVANTWTATASPACGRTYHSATLLPNGQVLITGGLATVSKTCLLGGATTPSAQASIEFYDPTSNTWDFNWVVATPQITPLPWASAATPPLTTSTTPTKTGAVPATTAPLQPILIMTTTGATPAPIVRYNHTTTFVPDCTTTVVPCTGPTGGWVLIAGGFNGNIALTDTDVITIPTAAAVNAAFATTNAALYTFNTTAINLNTASFSHSATLLTAVNGGVGGQVLLAGGSSGTSGAALARAELIDLTAATPTWTLQASQLSTPRVRHVAQLLSDGATILIAGGATNSNSASNSSALASVELYNSGSFTTNGSMSFARDALTAAPILITDINGNIASQVLLIGGQGITAAETFQ